VSEKIATYYDFRDIKDIETDRNLKYFIEMCELFDTDHQKFRHISKINSMRLMFQALHPGEMVEPLGSDGICQTSPVNKDYRVRFVDLDECREKEGSKSPESSQSQSSQDDDDTYVPKKPLSTPYGRSGSERRKSQTEHYGTGEIHYNSKFRAVRIDGLYSWRRGDQKGVVTFMEAKSGETEIYTPNTFMRAMNQILQFVLPSIHDEPQEEFILLLFFKSAFVLIDLVAHSKSKYAVTPVLYNFYDGVKAIAADKKKNILASFYFDYLDKVEEIKKQREEKK